MGSCAYNRLAKPRTSRTVSALPRESRTVEKRTKIEVFLSFLPRKEVVVRLLKLS